MPDKQTTEATEFAGFWRRLAAFLLDALVLGAVGLIMGTLLGPLFSEMGSSGRLIGFFVSAIYFGTLDSKLGMGQTIGKRLLKIRLVDGTGNALSVSKAFLRFLPIAIPWFLNNAHFSESVLSSFWMNILSIAIFGLGLSLVYLYIFNKTTRQSLHDLLVGSYVVKAQQNGDIVAAQLWKPHLVICALLLVFSALLPYLGTQLAQSQTFSNLLSVQHALTAEPWVDYAQVTQGWSHVKNFERGSSDKTILKVSAYIKDRDIHNTGRAKQLATLVLMTDASAGSMDVIQITLIHGYDIGIASSWTTQTYARSPEEWRAQ